MSDEQQQQQDENQQETENQNQNQEEQNKNQKADDVDRGKSILGGDKAAAKEGETEKKGEVTKAPEKYEFKLPEGVEADEKLQTAATEVFKKHGLSQEAANDLSQFYFEKFKEAQDAPVELWKQTQKDWVKEIKADPEIGAKLDLVKSTVAKAVDSLVGEKLGDQFRAAMDYTGAGNNPAFIRTMFKLAQQVTEGGHVGGKGPSEGSQKKPGEGAPSPARAIYPNLQSRESGGG